MDYLENMAARDEICKICWNSKQKCAYEKTPSQRLAAGATFKFPVTFAPNEKRIYTDSLSIQLNIPGTFQQNALCTYGTKNLHTAEVNLCGIGIYVFVDKEENSNRRCRNEVSVEFPTTIVGCMAEKNVTVENLSPVIDGIVGDQNICEGFRRMKSLLDWFKSRDGCNTNCELAYRMMNAVPSAW
ncbi:hypothetical protein T265_03488 [Opisthorchis viverrini]|uniref:Uncharacterized protein n=1 Tax=Opisthorchis viverrini TaxID=6198 RepID=A0A075AHJ8_OPIVI|nr:hypothetical protein T265_03488 [Opisthorchis viverrini]KER30009.1 hypothetical protein T265_03488 [Opisthorchis viverrini]